MRDFIKSLENTAKVHEHSVAFGSLFTYNKDIVRKDKWRTYG